MNKVFGLSALLIFCTALYLSFTSTWLAADINHWQSRWLEENKFYPALTACILSLPPLLVLVPLKLWCQWRIKKEG